MTEKITLRRCQDTGQQELRFAVANRWEVKQCFFVFEHLQTLAADRKVAVMNTPHALSGRLIHRMNHIS
jgi:hypothetical protein